MNFNQLKEGRIYTKLSFTTTEDKEKVVDVLRLSKTVWNFVSERYFEYYKRGHTDRNSPVIHRFNEDINVAVMDLFGVDKDFAIFVKRSVLETYRSVGTELKSPIKTKKEFLFHRFSTLHKPTGLFKLFLLKNKISCYAEKEEEISKELEVFNFEKTMIKHKRGDIWLSIPRLRNEKVEQSALTFEDEESMMDDELPEWWEDDQGFAQ